MVLLLKAAEVQSELLLMFKATRSPPPADTGKHFPVDSVEAPTVINSHFCLSEERVVRWVKVQLLTFSDCS